MKNSKTTKIVIVGGGFGGVYTYQFLHQIFHKDESIELVMISEHNYFLFTPLLHEVATGGQPQNNIVEPLRGQLCCMADLFLTRATKVDAQKQVVHTDCGEVAYDYLVLALGATTNFFGTPGTDKHVFTLKSIEDAIALKHQFIRNIDLASHTTDEKEREKLLNFVVVGGGPTGVELVAEMADLMYETIAPMYHTIDLKKELTITLIQSNKDLLPVYKPKLREKAFHILEKHGVTLLLNTKVTAVHENHVELGDTSINTNTVIWTAGIAPNTINFTTDVVRAKPGHLMTNEFLQLPQHEHIFALGDNASFTNEGEERPVPATAQTAVAQAEGVAKNIARDIKKQQLVPFTYHSKGELVSLGRWRAGATIAGVTFSGRLAWWMWRTIYLFKLLSWQKKVKVAVDWTLNLFSKRDISEV